MKTIALRFSDNYAPEKGMIYYHNEIIDLYGYVWYGKFGSKINQDILRVQLDKDKVAKFLLIKSGSIERYWVYITDLVLGNCPEIDRVPKYYAKNADTIKTWFKIIKFEKADNNVLSKCFVLSSGDCLSLSSKHSMNPYFKIEYKES